MPPSTPIRVRIEHTSALVGAGLRAMLAEARDIVVSDQFDAAPSALGDDVVITDSLDGLQRCQRAPGRGGARGTRILVVAQQDKEWDVRHALDQGAYGYVSQHCSPDELCQAVRALGAGHRYLSPLASRSIAASFGRAGLTGRETEVLQLLGQGHCNKLIAREMGIGVGTVKSHLKAVLIKLNATARTHAVVLATERGLIGPGRAATVRGPAPQPGELSWRQSSKN